MGRFENFTPPTLGSELTTAEITMLEEITALANSSSGQFIRKEGGSLVNSTLSETIALSGLSDVNISNPLSGNVLIYDGSSWKNSVSTSIGTVNLVSVVTANGVSGIVVNPTTTPAITLTLGAITPTTVNGLTLAAAATGFTIAGGTASKTLTVDETKALSAYSLIDGTRAFTGTVGGIDPVAGTDLTTKDYVDLAVTGIELVEYLRNDASDVGGYYIMQATVSGEAKSSFTSASLDVGDNQLLWSWVTPSGKPALNELIKGIYTFHYHAKKSADATKTVKMYIRLFAREIDTTETPVFTSEIGTELTDSEAELELHTALPDNFALNLTDRLVVKLYANVSGVSASPTVTVYMEGNTVTTMSILINAIDLKEIFVPYSGAISNVDLGGYSLTTGAAGVATGSILLKGTTSGTITLTVNAAAGTLTYVLPAAYGNAGDVLTDAAGDGVLSWAAGAGGGATTALDNLASVAINTSLISDLDITDDLGTGDIRWRDIHAETLNAGLTATDTLKLRGRDVNGAAYVDILTITSADIVTADLNTIVTRAGGKVILDADHTALQNVHGLNITAGQTLTVTTGGTIGSAAYTASGDYLAVAGTAADSSKLGGAAANTYALLISPSFTTPTLGVATGTSLDLKTATGGILTLSRDDTSVTASDVLGQINFWSNDTQTTTNPLAAQIQVTAKNTIETDINPGVMKFYTTPVGVAAALTLVLTLDETQAATFANTVNATTFVGALTGTASGNLVTNSALGTPASGTLTNCTGLPVAGITASTATALGVGSIELGHASDTTLSRSAAGVLAVEDVVIPSISSTNTLTNKRITARVQSVSDAATVTPAGDSDDCVDITAIAQPFTIANPSGTPTNLQKLIIRIKDNGTARAITWWNGYVAGGVALPSTTILSKILNLGFIYNTANALNKWQLVASSQEA